MSNGSFSGEPKTQWLSEPGIDRKMRLLEEFWYLDPAGVRWTAGKGSVVNGASIPEALWSSVGSPYTGEYRRASVVHDVACDTPAIPRERADDMFYFACLAGGCTSVQAKLLYVGVRIGSWAGGNALAPTALTNKAKPKLPSQYTDGELVIRAKYTLIAERLGTVHDDFEAIKAIVNEELGS